MIDGLIVTATEINSLKTAAHALCGRQNINLFHMSTLADQQRITWTQFLHIFRIYIESSLNRRSLTCYHNNFIVYIVMRRTNARRIANNKRIAMTQHTDHVVTAIHVLETALQNVRERYLLFNLLRNLQIGESLRLHHPKQPLVLFVNKMTDFLQHQYIVTLLFGLLSQID